MKQNKVSIQTQSLDDIWLAYRIVQPGDKVSGWTERKIKIGDSATEKASAVTIKRMNLTVTVEKITYENDGKNVRFLGPITEGNEYVSAGEYHTLSIDESTEITIEKKQWPDYSLRQLEEAALGGKGTTIIVAFDRSSATIGSVTVKGFTRLVNLEGAVQQKGADAKGARGTSGTSNSSQSNHSGNKDKESFYETLVAHIVQINERLLPALIILASSNFWKDPLFREVDMKAKELRKKVKWIECDDVSQGAISQLSTTKEFQQLTMGQSQTEILNSFEEVLRRIGTDGAATYGLQEVERAAQQSAISIALISQHTMHAAREKGTFEQIESLLSQIEQAGGAVHIVGEETTICSKLDGLGGIVALLRYKI